MPCTSLHWFKLRFLFLLLLSNSLTYVDNTSVLLINLYTVYYLWLIWMLTVTIFGTVIVNLYLNMNNLQLMIIFILAYILTIYIDLYWQKARFYFSDSTICVKYSMLANIVVSAFRIRAIMYYTEYSTTIV